MTPSYSHSTQVCVAIHRVAEVVLVEAIPTVTVTVGAVVKDVLITDHLEVDAEIREIGGVRVNIVSSFTHQLHPPGQAGVGGGGTGTTLTRDLVVGTDEGTRFT